MGNLRQRPPTDPVTIHLDRRPMLAQRGEPVAVALTAAGYRTLARSPKFHRPRGPACFRGGCDGCLARVDGVPNVLTCRVAALEGMRVETQNVVGTRTLDLLRISDWLFRRGLNHHEFLAGVPGLRRVMPPLARRMAGLGTLPSSAAQATLAARSASRRSVDTLVIGAGPSGMAATAELASRGRSVEVIDEDLTIAGSARALPDPSDRHWEPLTAAFSHALDAGVTLRLGTTAAGIYGDEVVVAGPGGVEVLAARNIVLAPGANDATLPFEGNDVPGVMSARAGCRLWAHGVAAGHRVVVVLTEARGAFGLAYARAHKEAIVLHGTPIRAGGCGRVTHALVATPNGERRLGCDALLVDAPGSPAYELCAQAGARLVHEPRGFVVRTGAGGVIRPGVFAVGEVVGTPLEPAPILDEARRLGELQS